MAVTYPVETIAALLDLSARRVQQLASEGVFPKADRGRYELVPVVKGYIRYLKERAIAADAPGDDGEHKRRLLKARADIAEMEAERMAGDLVPVAHAEKVWTDAVARFRQRSLSIAPKAAPLVAVETDTEACHEIIETYVHESLAELAATIVLGSEPAHEGDAGDLSDGGAASEADDLGVG